MRIYQQKSEQPIKWVVAAILFLVILCWSLSDVYGTEFDRNNQGNHNCQPENLTQQQQPQRLPSAVPEPTSMILFAAGLGGAAVYRRFKK